MDNIYMIASILDNGTEPYLYMKIENNVGYIWNEKFRTWIKDKYETAKGYAMGFEGYYEEVTKEEMDKLTRLKK